MGKTTTCVNLAAALALKGKKVLVVDFDPQSNASSALGIFDKNLKASVYGVMCDEISAEDAIVELEPTGLCLLPSSSDLAGAELELSQIVIGRERVLQEKLAPVVDKFDFVFVDCPPSLGLLTVNALTASDGVVIPIQCEFFALEGLSQMMNTVKLVKKHLNPSIDVTGVVLTMYDGRSKLSRGVLDEIEKFFGDRVFEAKIPRNIRLAEAPSYGKPAALYDKRCAGTLAYDKLAEEFLSRLE